MDPSNSFKVIIAGGSTAGLTLAIALERAGIDYELLEKRDIAPELGQSIMILPCTTLVHEQLGISKPLRDAAVPIKLREHWVQDGKQLMNSSDELDLLYKASGRPVLFVDRQRFLKTLYDGIRDKSKLRAREGVEAFTEHENGVTVRSDQGNLIEGSILVGADGVHSAIRTQIAQNMMTNKDKSLVEAAQNLTHGFKTRYRILTATSKNHFAGDPKRPFLADGVLNNIYHDEASFGGLSVAGIPGKIFWAMYIPEETPGVYPGPRFTQADVDAAIAKWGHLHVAPDYTFNDLYASVTGAVMISMEEGVIKTRWNSRGRVVLVGDAVHKATANLGMGGNLCVDDVCCLVNGLTSLLKSCNGSPPTTDQITRVFDEYEKSERPRANFVHVASGIFAGFETASTWWGRTLFRWVFPWIPSSLKMRIFHFFDRSAPKLDFLPIPESGPKC